ncbi:MAG: sugar phosphate isomerase/epimerase [Paludibacter sp.]|nr:sugar phosphate isomerase/epimerase [Paludibacter sp.]
MNIKRSWAQQIFSIACILMAVLSLQAKNPETGINGTTKTGQDCFKVSVCDWMILKRQKIGEFELARELGADGIEMDMGSLGQRDSFDNKLRKKEFRELFLQKAVENKIQISSIAMSGFYGQSFATNRNYKALVEDCIQTMQAMGVKTAFLPLGVKCDLNKYPELRPLIIERLKVAGKMAEKAGVVIGIETSLDANGEVNLLKKIGSKGIKISYNFQNPIAAGRDLYSELRILGKNRICQIHCTNTDGVTLPDDKNLDMNKVKLILTDMGWCGWLVVERSRDTTDVHNVKKNYGANIGYLKHIFNN